MNKTVKILFNGALTMFSAKPFKLSHKTTLFMDSATTLQQKYWGLTASHLIHQIENYDKEKQAKE